jgi:hypothetical protein
MPEINLIPKEYKERGSGFSNIFSKTGGIILALLILSLLIFGGLLFYKNKIKTNLEDINQEITNLESKRDNSSEFSIYYADKKINLVQNLFKDHVYWSKLFVKIQELVVPEVYFSDLKSTFFEDKLEVVLTGKATTYTALAKQMTGFKEDPLVEKISLTGTTLSEAGGVDFDFSIVFKKDILISDILMDK